VATKFEYFLEKIKKMPDGMQMLLLLMPVYTFKRAAF